MAADLRLVAIGGGWIVPHHLAALDRLGRTTLVGVASAREERAAAIATPRGARASADPIRLVDELRPDVAIVCVPPFAAAGIGLGLVERGIPFLIEKPLAAADPGGARRLGVAIAAAGLVVAVGYHLRGLEALAEVREHLRDDPPRFVTGRWLDGTPAPAWWHRFDRGGGQVIEQATHLYDLARHLVGEAVVVAAVSTRSEPADPPDADVADATAAILRFEAGALGTFLNSRRFARPTIDLELASAARRATIRKAEGGQGAWEIVLAEDRSSRTVPSGRDPYEAQAERFVDAVEARDPGRVLSGYADALRTDELTRAVVAATGQSG
ncbi:MAG TPA: Gfo/Idh/MocA family oxidoreductase [Candidatus Limnocylindrales bacterium]